MVVLFLLLVACQPPPAPITGVVVAKTYSPASFASSAEFTLSVQADDGTLYAFDAIPVLSRPLRTLDVSIQIGDTVTIVPSRNTNDGSFLYFTPSNIKIVKEKGPVVE